MTAQQLPGRRARQGQGRLWLALKLTIADGKITEMDVVADPDRLSQLTLAVLAD